MDSDEPDVLAMIRGYRLTALLAVVAELRVADALAHEPLAADDLARAVGADADALARVMRALVSHGLFVERDGRFASNPAAERLRSDVPGSLWPDALLAGREYLPAWAALPGAVRAGVVAFDTVFGTSVWEHRRRHAELGDAFNRFTARSVEAIARELAAACDLGRAERVVDVGGGIGALLAMLLATHPRLRGTLVDQPHVVASARPTLERAGVADRCALAPGDFFAAVPGGADVYLLKHVLHDWDDQRAGATLEACARAMTRPGARLVIVESPLPDGGVGPSSLHLLDVHMLAVDGGRERTRAEYAALLGTAGLHLVRVTPLRGTLCALEARR